MNKVMNKHSSSNIIRMFVQSYLVFNNVLKVIVYTSFMERFFFWNSLVGTILNVDIISECSENFQK